MGELALPLTHFWRLGWRGDTLLPLPSPAEDLPLESGEQESCPCPFTAAALGRAGPALCLGNTVELTLVEVLE